MNYWYMASPIGFLTLIEQDEVLVGLAFGNQVVGSTDLGGFGGGVPIKQFLLELEQSYE